MIRTSRKETKQCPPNLSREGVDALHYDDPGHRGFDVFVADTLADLEIIDGCLHTPRIVSAAEVSVPTFRKG